MKRGRSIDLDGRCYYCDTDHAHLGWPILVAEKSLKLWLVESRNLPISIEWCAQSPILVGPCWLRPIMVGSLKHHIMNKLEWYDECSNKTGGLWTP